MFYIGERRPMTKWFCATLLLGLKSTTCKVEGGPGLEVKTWLGVPLLYRNVYSCLSPTLSILHFFLHTLGPSKITNPNNHIYFSLVHLHSNPKQQRGIQ